MFFTNYFPMRGLRQKRKEILTTFILVLFFHLVMLNLSNSNISHRDLMAESDPVMYSYCSKEADNRGPHQNVISYSLYGNFSDPQHYARYTGLIKHILFNISQVYSGDYN
jgi:hypothetical protein